ncbi:amidohydrolase family protein [Glutamicibacter protophormiae]|uniref:metal-dependent hydrolase family protein n=1 Tax=Glutamicibacter protophormiae TaxID=37930 RepID=UPI003A9112DA
MSTLTLCNATVFDGERFLDEPANITLVDGTITAVGAQREGTLVDAAGRTVLPGLIDAHFHAYAVALQGLDNELGPLSYSALAGSHRLAAALRRGFTTVRDVAGGDLGLARAIDEKLFDSPRYYFTGPAFSQTGGHGDPREAHLDSCFSHGHMCQIVDGPDDLRVAVRNAFRTGAHAIKIMTSGGVISLTDPLEIPQYSPEEIRTITSEAARRGSYVCAHAYSVPAIRHSVENGVRSIEHGNLLDAETAKLMAEHDAYLVPTLAAYAAMDSRGEELGLAAVSQEKNRIVLERGQQAVRHALDAGVKVGFGSDLMGELGDEQLNGLALQAAASSVEDLLRSATSVNAQLIGNELIGSLAAGKAADLLVLDGDPRQDVDFLVSEAKGRTVIQTGAPVFDSLGLLAGAK